jgi:hypothetical protein
MTTTYSYAPPSLFERDDIELVKMFLSQFKDNEGNSYTLKVRPDVVERKEKAIEAIAVAENGLSLAIEHTLIQPFEGQMADNVPFLTVFEQFRTDSSLRTPNRFIDVLVPALVIPKGLDWKDVAKKVREWFIKEKDSFPTDGEKEYTIPDVGFELKVTVQTFDLPETEGVLVTGRILPRGSPFDDVLRKALHQKVPKLVATSADKHILLLEDGGTAIGFAKIGKGLDENVGSLPELKKVDAVWTVHTMGWKSNGDALFFRVWPGWTGQRFWIKDERFAKPKSEQTAGKTL